jgi:hypothetical protein
MAWIGHDIHLVGCYISLEASAQIVDSARTFEMEGVCSSKELWFAEAYDSKGEKIKLMGNYHIAVARQETRNMQPLLVSCIVATQQTCTLCVDVYENTAMIMSIDQVHLTRVRLIWCQDAPEMWTQ